MKVACFATFGKLLAWQRPCINLAATNFGLFLFCSVFFLTNSTLYPRLWRILLSRFSSTATRTAVKVLSFTRMAFAFAVNSIKSSI